MFNKRKNTNCPKAGADAVSCALCDEDLKAVCGGVVVNPADFDPDDVPLDQKGFEKDSELVGLYNQL